MLYDIYADLMSYSSHVIGTSTDHFFKTCQCSRLCIDCLRWFCQLSRLDCHLAIKNSATYGAAATRALDMAGRARSVARERSTQDACPLQGAARALARCPRMLIHLHGPYSNSQQIHCFCVYDFYLSDLYFRKCVFSCCIS